MPNLCKITVVKKSLQTDLIEKYHKGAPITYCNFELGEEFYCSVTQLPEGFCAWAYADIAREIAVVAYDPTCKTTKMACCTSGYHNVYFYIEPDGDDGLPNP